MKSIKTFEKFVMKENVVEKINKLKSNILNELFDDDIIRDKNIIPYLTKTINKEEISKTQKSYSFRLNQMILDKIPFYKKGNPEVHHDMIIYRFGNNVERLVVVIGGYLIDGKFRISFYIEKNNNCLNPEEVGDLYQKDDIISLLKASVPIIEHQFNIVSQATN